MSNDQEYLSTEARCKRDDYIMQRLEDLLFRRSFEVLGKTFGEQMSYPAATVDLPLISASELVTIDTSPLSELEIITEVGFTRKYKDHELNGLSLLFV